jgi:DNA-binding transcriptional ArsR family regulator
MIGSRLADHITVLLEAISVWTSARQREHPMNETQHAELQAALIDLGHVRNNADGAARLLRSMANTHRLMILCHLTHGERSVGALERELGMRQAHLSQQLARLRQDGLVRARRDSRTIYYALRGAEAKQVLGLMHTLFYAQAAGEARLV